MGGLDCGQYQILTDPCNGQKNPNTNFGNDLLIEVLLLTTGVTTRFQGRKEDYASNHVSSGYACGNFTCWSEETRETFHRHFIADFKNKNVTKSLISSGG